MNRSVQVIPYDRKHLPAFISLNRAWIEKHFNIEPKDIEQLENAESAIISPGGEIFFILENEIPIATCAMIASPHASAPISSDRKSSSPPPREYELAKMAVCESARGRGYGDLLMQAAIEWAKRKGASSIFIRSNTVLTPAITLYRKHGAVELPSKKDEDYVRCNIEMRIPIELNRI